jgi:hypothetical protein
MENVTENKSMSRASYRFAELLLDDRGVSIVIDRPNTESCSDEPSPYSWTQELKGEHEGTPGAREWFETYIWPSEKKFGTKVVTGHNLPKIKGNNKSAAGKGDIVIGILEEMDVVGSPYEQDSRQMNTH